MKRAAAILFFLSFFLAMPFSQQQSQKVKRIEKAFAPGFSFGVFKPLEASKLYIGGNFHYDLTQSITPSSSDTSYGGYFESFFEIGYYKEQHSAFNDDIFFTYLFGMNLSFEKFLNGVRRFLIPYFGIKVGGIYINHFGSGLLLQPTLGINLISTRSINISVDSQFLLNSVALSDYISLGAVLNINFNL